MLNYKTGYDPDTRRPTMKKIWDMVILVLLTVSLIGVQAVSASDETIRITCWEGYAKPFVKDFKRVIKGEYNIDIDVVITNPTDQDEFFMAAKNGTADLISPPADLAKTPRFYCFEDNNYYLSPVDLNHVPNFKNMLPFFKNDESLTHKKQRYGIAYNCGPYGLAYNTAVVKQAPATWNALWFTKYAGKYTINNNFHKCNIWITALSLGYTYDDIFDIQKLDRDKIQDRLNLLVENAASLWDGGANPDEFPQLSLATTWGFAAQQANIKGGQWLIAAPKEGGTAWIDYWCITTSAKKLVKRLCERWINYQLSPRAQAQVVKSLGVSPVVNNVGSRVSDAEKSLFHVGDNEYFKTVAIWQVMSEETESAFSQMWETAKARRK